MESDRWQRVRALFVAARGRDVGERERILGAAREERELLDEVRVLLEQDERESAALGDRAGSPGELLRQAWLAEQPRGAPPSTGFDAPDRPAPRPQRVGRYEILGVLGRGGMGVVYEALQERPHRRVALKITHADLLLDGYRARLFEREIRTLARLKHPGIADIYDAGIAEDGRPYYVMELVAGLTLAQFLAQRPLALADKLAIFRTICEAVRFAHRRGVIHRDLKPGNILVAVEREGERESLRVKLLDFGLARVADEVEGEATRLTEAGRVQGTLPYMSPEQVRGERDLVDVRSDVYALGVVLYEMLTGRLPYELQRNNLPDAARTIAEVEPVRPSLIERALRGDVETILLRALAKEPERRYPSADDLLRDVEHVLAGEPIAARRDSLVHVVVRTARRHRAAVSTAAVGLLALLAGVAWYAKQTQDRAQAVEQVMQGQTLLDCADPGLLLRARGYFDRAVELDPGFPLAYFERGRCLRRLSHDREKLEDVAALRRAAIGDFLRAHEASGSGGMSRAVVEAANTLAWCGDLALDDAAKRALHAEARDAFERAVRECPQDTYTRIAALCVRMLEGDRDASWAQAYEALLSDPLARQLLRSGESWLFDAVSRAQSPALAAALHSELDRQYEERFAGVPPEGLNTVEIRDLAGGFQRVGEHQRAIELYEAVRERRPADARLHEALWHSYATLGRANDALRATRRWVELETTPTAWRALAESWEKLGERDQARFAIDRACELVLDPALPYLAADQTELLLAIATHLDRAGELEPAADVYEALIARGEPSHAAWAHFAINCSMLGWRNRQIDALWAASSLEPSAITWLRLGVAYLQEQQHAAAEHAFEQSNRADPCSSHGDGGAMLARVAQGAGSGAIAHYLARRNAMQLTIDWRTVADAGRIAGDERQCERALREALAALPRDAPAGSRQDEALELELALCLLRQGRRAEAELAQQRALQARWWGI